MNYTVQGHGVVDLQWDPVYLETPKGSTEKTTINSIYLLLKSSRWMNSVCGVNHAVRRKQAVLLKQGIKDNHYIVDFKEIEELKDQEEATFTVFAYINREGGAIPYQFLKINARSTFFGWIPFWVWMLLIIVIIGLIGGVFYFRRKAKKIQSKLDYEMNDIRNVARVGYSDDTIERQNIV